MYVAVVLSTAALAPAAQAQSAAGDDPYDGRHVAVTVLVNRERAVVESVAVRPGLAHAQLAGSSRLRACFLDGRGDLRREFGFPDPRPSASTRGPLRSWRRKARVVGIQGTGRATAYRDPAGTKRRRRS